MQVKEKKRQQSKAVLKLQTYLDLAKKRTNSNFHIYEMNSEDIPSNNTMTTLHYASKREKKDSNNYVYRKNIQTGNPCLVVCCFYIKTGGTNR